MVTTRSFVIIFAAALVALTVIVVFSGSPVGTTPTALAGPCAAPPELYREDGTVKLTSQELYAKQGGIRQRLYEIDSFPAVPPPNKPQPYLTIEILPTDPVPAHPGIEATMSPNEANQQFDSLLTITVGADVPPGVYQYVIEIVCHPGEPLVTNIPVDLYVETCPAPAAPAGVASATPEPFPETCEEPTETPGPTCPAAPGAQGGAGCPTPTPTVVPTPTATPSATPLSDLWGDVDCSDEVNPIDSLKELRTDAGLPATQVPFCPAWNALVRFLLSLNSDIGVQGGLEVPWGDVDCSGLLSPVDSLKILREDAGLNVDQPNGCPPLGEEVAYELVAAQ
ncbi:MAG: hypothetical protein WD904_01330 [Dehalococcoidia bacterium]